MIFLTDVHHTILFLYSWYFYSFSWHLTFTPISFDFSSSKGPRYSYGWPKSTKSVRMKTLRQTHIKTMLLLVVFCSSILSTYAESQGIFELRLKSFANKLNKDSQGHCCDGHRTTSGRCSGLCSTKFRVCLKHYQLNIDPSHECTFGEHVTAPGEEKRGTIIQFPLDFKWPVSNIKWSVSIIEL